MSETPLKYILEAALLASGRPLSIDQCLSLFLDSEQPDRDEVRAALDELAEEFTGRSIELKQVASGYRIQVREDYSEWVTRLWSERPSRYSRALLETMALMAYRQPITRGEIEDIRGVSVSSNIIKTLMERDWIKVVGYRDVPGKPAMYGTTRIFLDYFNLKSLDELPTLAELRDIDSINAELDFGVPAVPEAEVSGEAVAATDETGEYPVVSSDEPTDELADVKSEDPGDEAAETQGDMASNDSSIEEDLSDDSDSESDGSDAESNEDDVAAKKTAIEAEA